MDAGAQDDAAVDRLIREQRIDILLELSGHSGVNRLPALASRPAPIIVSAIGYPNTTGLPAVAYRIVDSLTDPPGEGGAEAFATERLLRLDPGAFSTKPFVHEYWEEVFLLSGDLIVGSDAQGKGGESFQNYTYAVRPPGIYHGPFTSKGGCLMLETHFFDEGK